MQKRDLAAFYEHFVNEHVEEMVSAVIDSNELQSWQKYVTKRLLLQNDRQVLWIYDEEGNTGKSYLARYLHQYNGECLFENAKDSDLAYAYKNEHVVVFNYPRNITNSDNVNYGIIEKLKDGYLTSTNLLSTNRA